jgi:hypothetical protein
VSPGHAALYNNTRLQAANAPANLQIFLKVVDFFYLCLQIKLLVDLGSGMQVVRDLVNASIYWGRLIFKYLSSSFRLR